MIALTVLKVYKKNVLKNKESEDTNTGYEGPEPLYDEIKDNIQTENDKDFTVPTMQVNICYSNIKLSHCQAYSSVVVPDSSF